MNERVEQELDLLRQHYPDLEYRAEEGWVVIPRFSIPDLIWNATEISLCVQFPKGFPGNGPYGFYVCPRIKLKDGGDPHNAPVSTEPPFAGEWLKFSWSIPGWRATADLQSGYNMLNFILTIQYRLEEGA